MLKTVSLALLVLVVAIGGGAASVWIMLESTPPIGTLSAGPWTAYPRAGTPEADPYSRARFAREGGTPLGRAEGLVFIAGRDSQGAALRRACTYRIEGAFPPARLWTLHAVDRTGALVPPLGRRRAALHSGMVLYEPDGNLAVTVSAHPAPGNWLAVTGDGPVQLVLTLLDTPVSTGLDGADLVLPQIARVSCDD